MDSTGIKQIQETANIPGLIEQLVDLPVALVPESMSLKTIEHYLDNPIRRRFTFRTSRLADYIQYIKDNQTDTALTTILPEDVRMSSQTIFDFGTNDKPLHCENQAALGLKPTPDYAAALKAMDKRFSQRDIAEWIEDWSPNLAIFDKNGEQMDQQQASEALRRLTIEQVRSTKSDVGDFSEGMTISEQIEAKNQNRIPARIIFNAKPYLGFTEQQFTLRVSLLTDGNVDIRLRPIGLEILQDMIAEEFADMIREGLAETTIPVYISG